MKVLGPLDFGSVIAYLLPGFLAFFALSYTSPRVAELLEQSFNKDGGIGVELAIVLFSLTAGVVISAFRAQILDELHQRTGVERRDLDYSKLANKETLAAFNEAISNTYRFSQFYGNSFVALTFLSLQKLIVTANLQKDWAIIVVMIVSLLVLFFAHRNQLRETYKALSQILS